MAKSAGVVLIVDPQFDKIAAKALLDQHFGYSLPVFQYWDTNEDPTPEILQIWRDNCVIPIDIGSNDYKRRGTGSACESVVIDFEIPRTAGVSTLLSLVNQNNQTGFLKGRHESIVWTLREMYDLGYDPAIVVKVVSDVVLTFLDSFPSSQGEGAEKEFTVKDFELRLTALGVDLETVKSKAGFFRSAYYKAKAEQKRAERDTNMGRGFTAKRFGPGVLVVLEKDDRYLRRVLASRYSLIIFRNPSGNVTIQSRNGVKLVKLADELKRRESELWFYDHRLPACMNGRKKRVAIPATRITNDELIQLVMLNVDPPPTNVQQGKKFQKK